MTFRLLFAALPFAVCSAVAQCTPQPPVITSTAGTDGAQGHMFDITNISSAGVTILSLGQMMNLPGNSSFVLYTKPGSWVGFDQTPSAWTFAGSATVSHLGAPNVTAVPIPLDVAIPPGGTYGFYLSLTDAGSIVCGHTDGVTGQMQVIGTDGTIAILSGPAKVNPLFLGSVGTPITAGVVWNGRVTYCTGGSVDATNTKLGSGCIPSFDSFYELFPFASLASLRLTGNSLRFVRTPTGYLGEWLPGTAMSLYRAPVAPTILSVSGTGIASFNLVGAALPTAQGPQTTLEVHENGMVFWGPDIPDFPGPKFYPNEFAFLNNAPAGVYAWHDYDPQEPGSGPVVAEKIGSFAYVTYDNVESASQPAAQNRSTLQFQFDLISGDITLVFVRIDGNSTALLGSQHLIGISAQGPSNDPGSKNLATATLVAQQQVEALGLAAISRPQIGTNWNLRIDNIPTTAVLGLQILGLTDPGISDLASLGLPGCGLRASLDVVRPFAIAGSSQAYSEPIPSVPSLIGLNLYAAAAAFQNPPANAFGSITSNGLRGRIGDF